MFPLLLTIAIAVIAFPISWTQLFKLRKAGHSEGLSAFFVSLTACSCWTWFMYGVHAHQPVQLVVNGSGGVAGLLMLALLAAYSPRAWRTVAIAVTYIAATLTLGALAPAALFGAAGTFFSIVSRLPQLYKSYREPGGAAVSVPSFALTLTACSLWIAYGLLRSDVFVVSTSALGVVASTYIIARTMKPAATEVSTTEVALAA